MGQNRPPTLWQKIKEKKTIIFWVLVLAVIYYAVGRLSLLLAFKNTNATPIWPPSGIALAFVWRFGYGVWPGIFLGALLANMATFLANGFSTPLTVLATSTLMAIGNTLEGVLAFLFLQKYLNNINAFYKVDNIVKFIFLTMLACCSAASVGVTALFLSNQIPWDILQTTWITWWLGDVIGILTVTPLFLIFYQSSLINLKIKQIREAILLLVFLVVINIGIFGGNLSVRKLSFLSAYLLLPLIVWAAYRFGPVGASMAVLMTLGIATAGTINGVGPFAEGNLNQSLILLLIFIGVIAITGMILAAAIKESRRAEEELRKNEEKFRCLVENSLDMIALVDIQSQINYASSSTTNILGYPISEYVGHNIFEFIHPQDKEGIRRLLTQVLAQPEKSINGSCRLMDKNRKWRNIEGTAKNLLHDPIIKAIVLNYRDITEKKNALDTQFYLASIIENSEDAIFGKTLEGIVTSWNKGAEKIYGYTAEEVVGKNVDIIVPDDKKEELRLITEKLKEGKSMQPLETVRKRKDGKLIHVSVRVSFIKDDLGNLIGISTIARDITERKKSELALKESELRFRTMADTAPVMIWMSGTDTQCHFFNKAWLEFTGKTLEEEIGDGWARGVHPEDRDRCIRIYLDFFNRREQFTMDYRIRRWDGQYRWIQDTGVPRFTSDGRFEGYIGSCIDITERKMAEEIMKRDRESLRLMVDERSKELIKMQKELKQASRLADIGTLAATVAHELRNPLGVIQMATFNLKRKRADLSNDKHLTNIEKKVWEGNQIINNLLSYSSIKIPCFEQVNAIKVLDECILTTKNRFKQSDISLDKKYETNGNTIIEADPLHLMEVFNNILTNSYQAFPNNEGRIEVRALAEDSMLKFIFKDNGIGIETEDLEKVFTPFFTKKSKGTGLGLSICNELVTLHDGKIEIVSEKGVGTSVSVSLPTKHKDSHGQ
jgi:PAS domain S-box-containing protein